MCYTETMKSKELKTYNLTSGRTVNSMINAKPHGFLIFLFASGVVLSFLEMTSGFGIGLAIVSLLCLLLLPERIMAEFSDDYFVLYNKAGHSECMLIYYEDVVSWRYDKGVVEDELVITLEDGSSARIEGFSKTVFESSLNQYIPDKKEKTDRK